MRRLSDEAFKVGVQTLTLFIVLHGCMTSCGYDSDCFDGCPTEESRTVDHTTEITKTVTVVGSPGPKGDVGSVGPAGPAGQDGVDGTAAEPCTILDTADGLSVTCNGQTVGVSNGEDGTDGIDAVLPPGTIVDRINPCGPDVLDEVILVTADGTLIAHYSDGVRQHLTVLVPGAYRTTDGHVLRSS